MVGSSIFTFLALTAILIQNCPLANARVSSHPHRSRNANTNINTNINTFRKSRRLYEALARNEAETQNDKTPEARDIQTAVIASAAADAAKVVTRALTKKLSDTTADAVADAVMRVLTEEDSKKVDKKEQEDVAKAARRTSKFLNEAIARFMYRSDSNTPEMPEMPVDDVPPEIVEKMLETNYPSDQADENDKLHWVDGDGTQFPAEAEDDSGAEANRIHRRLLEYPDTWRTHYRRATPVKRNGTPERRGKTKL